VEKGHIVNVGTIVQLEGPVKNQLRELTHQNPGPECRFPAEANLPLGTQPVQPAPPIDVVRVAKVLTKPNRGVDVKSAQVQKLPLR
jgi:hypothetical protein